MGEDDQHPAESLDRMEADIIMLARLFGKTLYIYIKKKIKSLL